MVLWPQTGWPLLLLLSLLYLHILHCGICSNKSFTKHRCFRSKFFIRYSMCININSRRSVSCIAFGHSRVSMCLCIFFFFFLSLSAMFHLNHAFYHITTVIQIIRMHVRQKKVQKARALAPDCFHFCIQFVSRNNISVRKSTSLCPMEWIYTLC